PRWRVTHDEKGDAILVPSVESGIVLVHAELYDSFDPLYARATALLADLGFRVERSDDPRKDPLGDLRGTIVTSTGNDSAGHALVARARAVLSDKGIGTVAVGFATPAAIRDLGPRIDEIVRSFRFGDFTPEREAMAKLAGTWTLDKPGDAPPGSFAKLVFAADGTIRATWPAGADGKSDVGDGRFAILGGTLILSSQRNGSHVVDFALDAEHLRLGGATYTK
ncbi:MAG: hypothetical protein HYR85_15510, partial [Planctomycetes bacterium]|nr:hypothetical protein [Planctomycetota bacterium]